MAFVEKTGKSVDEAVAAALAELNVTADQAVVEVLEEAKKGFLGFGRKDARVRVSVKPAEAEAENLLRLYPLLKNRQRGCCRRCSCSKGGCNCSCRCSG